MNYNLIELDRFILLTEPSEELPEVQTVLDLSILKGYFLSFICRCSGNIVDYIQVNEEGSVKPLKTFFADVAYS